MVVLFAMNRSSKLSIYVSLLLEPMDWKEDVFQLPWNLSLFAFIVMNFQLAEDLQWPLNDSPHFTMARIRAISRPSVPTGNGAFPYSFE